MDLILIGKIVTAVGIKGEVKVYSYTDYGRFKELNHIYISGEEYIIEKAREDGNIAVLKLKDINDRDEALKFRNKEVYIGHDDLRKLDEDEYFYFDLIGLSVFDIKSEKMVGKVKDVLDSTAQVNLEISYDKGTFMLPFVKAFIKEVSLKDKVIKVELIPGFIDEGVTIGEN